VYHRFLIGVVVDRFNRQEIYAKLRAYPDKLPYDLRDLDIAAVYEVLKLAFVATNIMIGTPFPQPLGVDEGEERKALDLLHRRGYIDADADGEITGPLLRKGELLGRILAAFSEESWETE
jgi:hypothetical protein